MTTCFLFVLLFIAGIKSQTDVSSFGILTSSEINSETSAIAVLTLSWNLEQWQCIINTTNMTSSTYYGCTSHDVVPTATLISNTLPSNTYLMKLELIGNNTNDLLRIETIRVMDDDSNYYDIDTFCVPPEFSHIESSGALLGKECCYWSDRYKYNDFAMGNEQNAVFKIAYAQYRDNILDYPNTAHEGAIKPPMIKRFGIKTLNTANSASSATFSFNLHWDSEEYLVTNLMPNASNSTFLTTFNSSTTTCEFSSGFSLEVSSTSNDTLGIDTIIIQDESGYYYNIDYFCNSPQINDEEKYSSLATNCDNDWFAYLKYDGFMYKGTDMKYFIWDSLLFKKVGESQQGFALDDSIFANYDCSNNIAPTSIVTIFKDKTGCRY